MKKIRIILVFVLAIFFTIIGCSNSSISTGLLTINLSETTTRTIRPGDSLIKISSYRIIGSYDGSVNIDKTFNEKTITLDQLRSGDWKFQVLGLNENGDEIAHSDKKEVKIIQNEKSSLSFVLNYLTDSNGIMNVKIKLPSADTSVYKIVSEITPINNSELKAEEITLFRTETTVEDSTSIFCFRTSLNTGRYRVKFTMYDSSNNKVGYALNEVLHIYSNIESSYEWYWDKDYIPPVAEPVFSLASGLYLDGTKLEIATSEEDATIYYTTDKTIPTKNSNEYKEPIVLDKTMTINAIAIKDGLVDSAIASESFTVKVNTPTISLTSGTFNEDQKIRLSCSTLDSKIYYTLDGTEPTASSTLYSSEIALTKNASLKAIAIKEELETSEIASADYKFLCLASSVNYDSGTYNNNLTLRLSTTTDGASIYYTLNGEEPTVNSLKYEEGNPISIDESKTLRAITVKDGWNHSAEIKKEYVLKCSTPTISVASGSYSAEQTITLSTETKDATIYYTLDGTEPIASSYVYTSSITIKDDCTLTVVVKKSGYTDSDSVSNYYYIAPQKTNVSVLDPIETDFRMGMPQGWHSGMNLLQTLENATLFVDTTSNVSNIKWFYDGYEKEAFRNKPSITVGKDSSKDIPLELGGHVISLRVLIDHISYTENLYYNCVAEETTEDFVFWGDLELGGVGPGGGYLIYDVDADNASGNADGLKSRDCGWKYIEVAPNDLRLINGVPSISNTESNMSTFIFGYYTTQSSQGSYADNGKPTSMLFNTGYRNTEALVKTMGNAAYTTQDSTGTTDKYAAKLCWDLVSHEREGAIKGWFLPSFREMWYIIENLPESEKSTFTHEIYWTSSESTTAMLAYRCVYSRCGHEEEDFRSTSYGIRPIRRF